MNALRLLLPLAFLAAFAAPATAVEEYVTVTVSVGDHYHLLPASTVCEVQVLVGANAGDALDAAVESGCLGSWTWGAFEGLGRYVTSIDGRAEDGTFYWVWSENGATASYGIDAAIAQEGDVFDFRYGVLASFFLP